MIPKSQIRELAEKLLAKTRAKQVNWQHHYHDNTGCELLLEKSSIELTYESPAAEPDRVTITINRLDDELGQRPIAELMVSEGEPDWDLYHTLYDAASRIVYKWDQVLNEVQTAINAPGPIGRDAE